MHGTMNLKKELGSMRLAEKLDWKGLSKLEYYIQQYPSNVNNWDPNRKPKIS
jgi:hypothetical protein